MPRYRNRGPAQRRLGRALNRIEQLGSERARQVCELICDEANDRAPYDTRHESDTTGPHLRGSYQVRPKPDGSGDWQIVTGRRYWVFVEFGTREHGDAQPHLRPAIEYARGVLE